MQFSVAVVFIASWGFIECGFLDSHPFLLPKRALCKEQSGVSEEVWTKANQNNLQANDRNLQCYTKCMFEQVEGMDENGKVDLTKFINSLTPKAQEFFGPIMMECQATIDDADACMKGMKLYQCFQEKSGEKYEFA